MRKSLLKIIPAACLIVGVLFSCHPVNGQSTQPETFGVTDKYYSVQRDAKTQWINEIQQCQQIRDKAANQQCVQSAKDRYQQKMHQLPIPSPAPYPTQSSPGPGRPTRPQPDPGTALKKCLDALGNSICPPAEAKTKNDQRTLQSLPGHFDPAGLPQGPRQGAVEQNTLGVGTDYRIYSPKLSAMRGETTIYGKRIWLTLMAGHVVGDTVEGPIPDPAGNPIYSCRFSESFPQ
jgi:hypothetical protein